MLVADINIGYEEIANTQVSDLLFPFLSFNIVHMVLHCHHFHLHMKVLAFNGKPVKNLKSLATMVENSSDEYLKFDLDYDQVLFLLLPPLSAHVRYCI